MQLLMEVLSSSRSVRICVRKPIRKARGSYEQHFILDNCGSHRANRPVTGDCLLSLSQRDA